MKTGACGWPLVPSKRWPGEDALACPKCGSQHITMTTRSGYGGTGPMGRWRMGDPGGTSINICESCGFVSDGGMDPRKVVVATKKRRSRRGGW